MTDYNRDRDRNNIPREKPFENYNRRGNYPNDPYNDPERINRAVSDGYSSYGAHPENPYRHEEHRDTSYNRTYGDPYPGNFSGSNYDHDYDFGLNRRDRSSWYGEYANMRYNERDLEARNEDDYYRQDWRHNPDNPNNLGVRSNYSYNRGGYGSNFGGEYGHFPTTDAGAGYVSRFGQASYDHNRHDWAWGNPDREYSSYTGRSDEDNARRWKHDNRDWLDKTKDEVSSWFGDRDAERRRRQDVRGEHAGRGPKGYQRSDTRIEEDINERLSMDGWVDATDINIHVADGDVVLSGSVPDRQSKRRAEDVVESVTGVKNVENRIRVMQEDMNQAASYRRQ
jgi:osmotically-inducible protein OsmY